MAKHIEWRLIQYIAFMNFRQRSLMAFGIRQHTPTGRVFLQNLSASDRSAAINKNITTEELNHT